MRLNNFLPKSCSASLRSWYDSLSQPCGCCVLLRSRLRNILVRYPLVHLCILLRPPPKSSNWSAITGTRTTKIMPLAARSSLEARRIIHEAFKGLEKIISPSEAKDFNDTTLQNVQDAALEIESILAARQSLRNMRRLSPLFEGIKCYAETIEVLCNGTPYLPWIWAPIKLILKASIVTITIPKLRVILTGARFPRIIRMRSRKSSKPTQELPSHCPGFRLYRMHLETTKRCSKFWQSSTPTF